MKRKCIKQPKKKSTLYIEQNKDIDESGYHIENSVVRWQWHIFKTLQENKSQTFILYSVKVFEKKKEK